jgi:hypothetical protein
VFGLVLSGPIDPKAIILDGKITRPDAGHLARASSRQQLKPDHRSDLRGQIRKRCFNDPMVHRPDGFGFIGLGSTLSQARNRSKSLIDRHRTALCFLTGRQKFIVHWEIRESMTERDVETIVQRARERFPEARPRIISDNGPQFVAWESLAKRSPYWAMASRTSVGNSTIIDMIICSAVQLRQSKSGAKRTDFAYFDAVAERNAKPQS